MADYSSYFDHLMFVQPIFQNVTQLTSYLNGSHKMMTPNSTIVAYHMADVELMLGHIADIRRQVHCGTHKTLSNASWTLLMNQDKTDKHNLLGDDADFDDNNEIENFGLGAKNSSNNDKPSAIDDAFLPEAATNETHGNDNNMHDGNHDNSVDNVDTHDDKYEANDSGSIDTFASLHALDNVVDAFTREREMKDSDFHLGDLFNINIGAGGCIEIIELKDSLGQLVHCIRFLSMDGT